MKQCANCLRVIPESWDCSCYLCEERAKERAEHMAKQLTRTYYKLRDPSRRGQRGEYYCSNNGTSQWGSIAKVKSMITRGQRTGYKGSIRVPFDHFEVIEVTENVTVSSRVLEVVEPEDNDKKG